MQIQKLYQPNIVVSNVGFSAFDPLNFEKKKSSDGERVTTFYKGNESSQVWSCSLSF